MKTKLFLGRWTLIIAVFGLLSLFAGGIAVTHAVGVIPAADGTIHACYKTHKENKKDKEKEGNLRVVSSDEECKKNESAISWYQGYSGPGGTDGAVGPTGPAGADGAAGADGVSSYSIQTNFCGVGTTTCTATCPVGHKILGGGYEHAPGGLTPFLQRNGPIGDNAWQVTTRPTNIFVRGVTIFATCADTN